MFDRILIPTDGSEPARYAAKKGIDLAAEHDATVQLLYVVEPMYAAETATGQVMETLRSKGNRILAELAEEAAEYDLETASDVRQGTPHEEILDYAEANDSDLVVMGTHGRTGLGRYLVGSVTQKVVRLADVPVLTVQNPDEE